MYNIKGYVNDDNDITEKYPSVEYVIEVNYNKQNPLMELFDKILLAKEISLMQI